MCVRICYVADVGNKISGGHQSLINLIEEIRSKKVYPYVVSNKNWELIDYFKKTGIKTKVVRSRISSCTTRRKSIYIIFRILSPVIHIYNKIRTIEAVRFLKKNKIDLVHMNSALSSDIWAVAARRLNIPYIIHIREFMDLDHGREFWDTSYTKKILQNADLVIAISKSIKEYWDLKFSINCHVIYNGLPIDRYKIPIADKFHSKICECIIVGRIRNTKGQLEAVQAIEKVIEMNKKNIHLSIIGYRGCDKQEAIVTSYVKEKRLEEFVTFEAFTYDVNSFRQKAHIGLTCSTAEAFGRTTVENMLGGCVAIGSNTGGTPELIQDGVNGFIYEKGNVEQLANYIAYIMDHMNVAEQIAVAGQKDAEKFFSIVITAQKVFSEYNNLLDYKVSKV